MESASGSSRKDNHAKQLERQDAKFKAKLSSKEKVVDYVRYWSNKPDIKAAKMIRWVKITRSKYYD
ncbi:MAG: hypothetical protein JXB29_10095 [Sedimentisphaerales bacterium]|nr:hypothetical protein [Sedimentisphaerales bacterium]